MTDPSFYVTGIAVSQFVHGAETLGLNSRDALSRAGLREAVHLRPGERVPEAAYERLLLELIVASQNDSFGADIGKQLMPPLYGVLMSLALSAATVGEAFAELARYQGLASGNCGALDYSSDADGASLTITMAHQNPVIRRHVAECVLTQFAGLIRLMTGRRELTPDRASVEHGPASEAASRRLAASLGCPVAWRSHTNQLHLNQTVHEFPLLGHGEDMLHSARQLAERQLAAINERTSAVAQIRLHVRELMRESSPRRETVADRLHISTRTLDRRLAEAGLNWQALVDGLRAQLAVEYLADDTLTVAEVAGRLGFSEIRSFQRRFRKWTGLSPSDYRQQVRSNDNCE